MYLLDTNILSELMRAAPNPAVLAWVNRQAAHDLYISAITRAEIELGIALLPAGKRRTQLAVQAKAMLDEDFTARCLPFDEKCAPLYAALVAARTRQGLPISVEDAQIAAVSLASRKTLVTRNTADFAQIQGLEVVNPFTTD
jgi:toxin FitB